MSAPLPEVAVEVLAEADFAEWDAFVDASAEASPFSKSAWLRAFLTNSPTNTLTVAVIRDKVGRICAGVAMLMTREHLGGPRAIVPGLHPHVSFLFRPMATDDADRTLRQRSAWMQALLSFARNRGLAAIRLVHHPGVDDVRPFLWENWTLVPSYTFLLDLPAFSIESVGASYRPRHRKCQAAGYTFATDTRIAPHLATILALLRKTFLRQGLDPDALDPHHGGLEAYERYLRVLEPSGCLRYFEAREPGGEPVSVRVGASAAGGTFYDWIAGTDPEYLKAGASIFLVVEMLLELQRQSFRTFDFGGANTPGIADFKQGFNGRLVCGFDTRWQSNAWRPRLVRAVGGLAHHVRKALRRG